MFLSKKLLGIVGFGVTSLLMFTTVFAQTSVPLLLCPWGCGPTESDQMLMNMQIRDKKAAVFYRRKHLDTYIIYARCRMSGIGKERLLQQKM